MVNEAQTQSVEAARFYTRSRRIKQMIGTAPGGDKIPGGPYTIAQVIFGLIAAMLALMTRGLWSTGSVLLDLPLALMVTWAAAWASGKIPARQRNLLSEGQSILTAIRAPQIGRVAGRQPVIARPHAVVGQPVIARAATSPAKPLLAETPAVKRTRTSSPPRVVPAAVTSAPVHTASPPRVPPPRDVEKTSSSTPLSPALSGVQRLLIQAKGESKQ